MTITKIQMMNLKKTMIMNINYLNMKKIIIASFLMLPFSHFVYGQTPENEFNQLKLEISNLQSKQTSMQNTLTSACKDIVYLTSQNENFSLKIDSLNKTISVLRDSLHSVNAQLKSDINATNNTVSENEAQLTSSIKNKSIIGLVILAILSIIGIIVSFCMGKKLSKADSAIDNVKDAQSKLQSAQKKLEEESILLDNKLVELIEKKISSSNTEAMTDHSLALKVADEITRIELNLSKMDSSIKGYKQLSKGIERIKNNFMAKGYEIADMLGKPYNEGMRINADFVLDESLEPGTRTITAITKPQVIFNGELIQKAIVTVTQNI